MGISLFKDCIMPPCFLDCSGTQVGLGVKAVRTFPPSPCWFLILLRPLCYKGVKNIMQDSKDDAIRAGAAVLFAAVGRLFQRNAQNFSERKYLL